MPDVKKYTVVIPPELPQRKQAVLNRLIAVFDSYQGNVPKALLDAIDALTDVGLDMDTQCERLESLLDRWARLH